MPLIESVTARLDSSRTESAWNFHADPSPPSALLRHDPRTHQTHLHGRRGVEKTWSDPLEALKWLAEDARTVPSNTRWIGFISYDLGRLFEKLPSTTTDDLSLPLFCFSLHEPSQSPAVSAGTALDPDPGARVRSTFSRQAYESAVRRSIDYIAAGDVFQVNLSQRFTAALTHRPQEVYQRLREHAPARHGAHLDYGDFALVSNSPELFLQVLPQPNGTRRVITRPVKGTRPRTLGMEQQLRDSVKDQAELHMIVDLERNDLGRVCEIGSVQVTEPRVIEPHPTVFHGVSTIEGVLRQDVSFVDLLRATFPGGSVTGAPKIRAMEIIEELEPVRRGPYCGAIGYLAPDGRMEFNIAIRTMIVKDNQAHIPVGGGIVADSNPAAEYEETIVKARAMFAALGIRAEDLMLNPGSAEPH